MHLLCRQKRPPSARAAELIEDIRPARKANLGVYGAASWVRSESHGAESEYSKDFSPGPQDRAVRMVCDRQTLEGGPRAESICAVPPQLCVDVENAADLMQPLRPG